MIVPMRGLGLCVGVLLLSSFAAALPAEDAKQEQRSLPIDPTLLSWSAGSGLSLPSMVGHELIGYPPALCVPDGISAEFFGAVFQPPAEQVQDEAPGRFAGGVTMLYELVRLQADRVDFWQSPLMPEDDRAWPGRAVLLSGPDGPETQRVHIDTRYTALPMVSFTGLLRPRQVVIDRAPFAGEVDEPVVYRIILEDVQYFRGEVRHPSQGWRTVTGYADHMLIIVHAQRMSDGRLSEPSVRAFHMFAGADRQAQLTVWSDPAPLDFASSRISIMFHADGSLERFAAGKDARMGWLAAGSTPPERPGDEVMRDPQLERAVQQRRQ